MSNRDSVVIDMIRAEIKRQEECYGSARIGADGLDNAVRFAILGEEVGEVAREVLPGQDMHLLRKELIQVAACAMEWAKALSCACGDSAFEGEWLTSFSIRGRKRHTRERCTPWERS